MNRDLYSHALYSEGHDPRKALRIYSRLHRENLAFRWVILLACLAGPIAAFSLAKWVRSRFHFHDVLITIFVWVGVGTLPGLMMYAWKRRKAAAIRVNFFFNIIGLVLNALCIYFGVLLHALGIVVYGAISFAFLNLVVSPIYHLFFGIPVTPTFFEQLPFYLYAPMAVISLVYGFLLVIADPVRISDPLWPHLFKFKRMLIALCLRWKRAMFFVLAICLVRFVREMRLDLIYEIPLFGLAMSLVGGTLFALQYGFIERNVTFGHLLRLAMVRCSLRLGNQEEADLRLMLEEEQSRDIGVGFAKIYANYPKVIVPLTQATRILVLYADQTWNPDRAEAGDMLREGERSIGNEDQNRTVYLDAIRRTKEILYPYLGEYTAIARVLRSEFYYPPGEDPRLYERFEYEYYKTGQRIDVDVIDGQMYFDQVYYKGDRITGIWGCAETDLGYVQIFGKPEVGDLVGYYTNRLSFGACNLNWVRISEKLNSESGKK